MCLWREEGGSYHFFLTLRFANSADMKLKNSSTRRICRKVSDPSSRKMNKCELLFLKSEFTIEIPIEMYSCRV